jgi:hypothetical protein
MAFDPQEFLKEEEPQGFDPAAFLAEPETAQDMYNQFDSKVADVTPIDATPEEKDRFGNSFKRRMNSQYISTTSGINASIINESPETYRRYAKTHGFTGNTEADFIEIGSKFAGSRIKDVDSLVREDRNVTNSFLRGLITDGVGSLAETFFREAKNLSGFLAEFDATAPDVERQMDEEVQRLAAKVLSKETLDASDPDLIAWRQAKVQLDVFQDTRRAEQREGLFYEKLEEWEATVRTQRAFDKETQFTVEDEFANSFKGQLITGAGNMVYSLGSFAGGPITGFAANSGAIYQGTVDDARAHGATESEAWDAGVAQLPAAALDSVIDKFLVTRFLKPMKGKMTVGQLIQVTTGAVVSGGMSEGAEQLWQNANAKYLTKYDPKRTLDDGVLTAIALGGILGFAPTPAGAAARLIPGVGSKVKEANPTNGQWDLIRKTETDEEIIENRGPRALDAANGDQDARTELNQIVIGKIENKVEQPFGEPRRVEEVPTSLPLRPGDRVDIGPIIRDAERDVIELDIQAREDDIPPTPEEKRLFQAELEQEIGELDAELKQAAPELVSEDLSRSAKNLAEIELAESEAFVGQEITPSEQLEIEGVKITTEGVVFGEVKQHAVDKQAAKFLSRIVKTENRLGERIDKLKDQIKTNKTQSKVDKLASLVKAAEKLKRVKKLAQASKREALSAARAKFEAKLSTEVNKRLDVVKKNLADRRALTASTRELKQIIKELPRNVRGDLNTLFETLSKRRSPEAQAKVLQTAIAKVDAKIESFNQSLYRAALKRVVKAQVKELVPALGGGKRPGRKLNDIKTYLEERGLFGGEAREQNLIAADLIQKSSLENENKGDLSQLSDADRDILQKSLLPDLSRDDLPSKEYLQALGDLKTLRDDGKTLWEKRQSQEKVKLKSQIFLIFNEIDQRLKQKGNKALRPEEVKEFEGKLSIINQGTFSMKDYRSVSAMLSGLRTDSQIKKILFDKISNNISDSMFNHDEYVRFVQDLEKKHGLNMTQLGDQDLIRLEHSDRVMTNHQAMFVYGHSQNRSGQRHLANTEFGGIRLKGPQVDQIIEALPQNHKDFVDALIDYNDTVMRPRMNEVFNRVYGVDMPWVERYLPLSGLTHTDSFDSILGEAYRIASTNNTSMKARTGSKAAFSDLDLLNSLYRHNQSAEHTISMREDLAMFNQILSDKALQNQMNSVNKTIVPWLKQYLEDVGRGRVQPPNGPIVGMMRMLGNNVRAFHIAVNFGAWFKTQVPLVSVAQDVGKAQLINAMMRPWNGESNWQLAKSKSKMMATRPGTARIQITEIAEAKDRFNRRAPGRTLRGKVTASIAKKMLRMQESAYWAYTPMDTAATSAAWVAKYLDMKNTGHSESESIHQADEIVKVHFPSGRIEELPALFRSGGAEKELTRFTADMNRMLNLGYTKTQLKDRKIQEAIVFGVYSVILSSISLALTDVPWDILKESMGTKEPEKDRGERFLKDAARYGTSQVLGGIPAVGTFAEARMAKVMGDSSASSMMMQNTPIWFYPAVQFNRGNYLTSAASAAGVPAGNLVAPLIDDYLKDED